MMGRDVKLYFQENFFPVQEIEEEPANGDIPDGEHQWSPVFREQGSNTTKEKLIGVVPLNDPVGQVDGDRVHADYHEEECPLPQLPYVDDQVEECQEQ